MKLKNGVGRRVFFADPLDRRLWKVLRANRHKQADQQVVPPYVISHDTTLLEFVDYKTRLLDEMHQLSGIGERKLEKYENIGNENIEISGRIVTYSFMMMKEMPRSPS